MRYTYLVFCICLQFSIATASTGEVFTEPLARYGLGTGRDIAVTADDSRAFVAGDYGISVWDLTTGEMLSWLVPENRTIRKILLSPDASVIYTLEADYVVRARSTATGQVLRSFTGHTDSVNAMALSYDGTKLVTGSSDKTVKVWNTSTGEVIRTFEEHRGAVYAVDIMRDGARVVSGGGDEVFLWNISNGVILQSYDDFYCDCLVLKFSPGGSKLYMGNGTSVRYGCDLLYCFDTFSGSLIRYFEDWPYLDDFFAFDISNDGNAILLDGEWFGRITDEHCRDLYSSIGPTRGKFSSVDSHVISLDCYEGINVVNVTTGDISLKCHGFSDGINTLALSPEGSRLLLGSESNQAQLWDMESSRLLKAFPTEDRVSSCAFSPDGTLLAFSSKNKASIFNAATYDLVTSVTMYYFISQVEFLPDNRLMTEDYYSTNVYVWDIASETTTACIEVDPHSTNDFILSPDGEKLLEINGEKVNIWDIDNESILRTLSVEEAVAVKGCFSPDGNRAVLVLSNRTVIVIDVHTGEVLTRFTGHTSDITAISFAPDGSRVLTGGTDRITRLWNSYTGEELAAYQYPKSNSSVNDVAFSPDGSYAITAGNYSPALLWVAAIGIVETPVPSSTPTETMVSAMSPTPSITDTYTATSTPTVTDTPTETATPTPTLDPVFADIDADGYVDIDDLLHVMKYWHQQVRQETDYAY